MESLSAASPLLAPSDPPTSFLGLNAARQGLPHLRAAQYAARHAINQRLGERRGGAAEHIMNRIGMTPHRPSVQHPPPSIVMPPSVTPGAHPAPPSRPGAHLSHLPVPAAPQTPAARLLMRRPPAPHPAVQAKPYMGSALAKTPLRPIQPAGSILKRYMRTVAGGGDDTTSTKELSEEELKAANEKMVKNEPQLKQQILQVVQANVEKQKKKHPSEAAAPGGNPVAQIAMEALTRMTGGRPGSREAVLRDIAEAMTGRVVVPECVIKQTRILGVGGLGVVIEAEVVDDACRKAVGMNKVALKVLYENVKGIDLSRADPEALANSSNAMIKPELEPLDLIQQAVKDGRAAQDLMKKKRWALPAFSASAGNVQEVYVHNDFLLSRRVLVSEMMAGDGLMLLPSHDGASLPMEAREYACAQLLTSVAGLHNVGLAHYDIKPENILVSLDGTIHLADFGMCGRADVPKPCAEGLTPLYADPPQAECFQRRGMLPTSKRYDTWSMGVTCYVLMTGTGFPYKIPNNNSVLQHLSSLNWRSSLRPPAGIGNPEKELQDAGASDVWAKIVKDMLTIPRDKRPTPMDIIKKYHIGGFGHD
ncbi:hypothetical protein Emed_006388 [Eimeria media]